MTMGKENVLGFLIGPIRISSPLTQNTCILYKDKALFAFTSPRNILLFTFHE